MESVYFRNGIALPDNPLIIDGGANIGSFSLYVLQHHPTATVVAVEPAPKPFHPLRAITSQFATATAHNYALRRKDGTMPFTVFSPVTLPLLMELLRKRDFTAISGSEGLKALARKAMIYAQRAAGTV